MTRGERPTRPAWVTLGWLAGLLVAAGVCVVGHLLTFTQLSPVDEYQHVDYLDRTLHLEHVNGGEQVEELAMREQACRGLDLDGFVLPPCDAEELLPEQLPGSGYNHAYVDPPGYYVITAPLAKLTQSVTGVDSVVTAARGIGVLWLGAGLVVTFLLARRLGADDAAAAGASLLLAVTPLVLQGSATVTTDAPELLVGGALTLLSVAVVERRTSPWWLLPAGAAAMTFKGTSLAIVGVLGLFLLVEAVRTVRRRGTTGGVGPGVRPGVASGGGAGVAVLPALLLLSGAAATLLAWTAVRTATALPTVDDIPANKGFEVDSIGWSELAPTFVTFMSPVQNTNSPAFTQTASLLIVAALVNLLLVVGAAGAAWFGDWGEVSTRLATCVVAGMALGGPAFTALIYLSEGLNFIIPGRYGLSLLSGAAACLAVVASRRRYGGPALVALGVLGLAAFVAACL